MDEYGKSQKKFVFYDSDHNHAKLRIKFVEDGVKQASFFKEIVKAYIEDDPLIIKWLENNPQCRISKRSLKIRKRERKKIEEEKKQFNLDQDIVDELFDILADEFGD